VSTAIEEAYLALVTDGLAIDLGTSNTVAVVRGTDALVRPVLFDGHEQLPSAVYADADGQLVAGHDAERLARADRARSSRTPSGGSTTVPCCSVRTPSTCATRSPRCCPRWRTRSEAPVRWY
jgi:hypothetical protein